MNDADDETKSFDTADQNLHAALCDNFNTPAAMKVLTDLIGSTNKYMFQTKSLAAVKKIASWVEQILTIFGLYFTAISSTGLQYLRILSTFRDKVRILAISNPKDISKILLLLSDHLRDHDLANLGIALDDRDPAKGSWVEQILTIFGPDFTAISSTELQYLRILSTFRDKVRTLAISNPKDISKLLLLLSDHVRDHDLANLGVALEDRDLAKGERARIRFVSAEELIVAREEKERRTAEKERKREEDRKREELAKVSHLELFKTGDYSEWDEQGIPTKDKEGVEITKSGRKTLVKGWERQKKLHEAWLKAKSDAA